MMFKVSIKATLVATMTMGLLAGHASATSPSNYTGSNCETWNSGGAGTGITSNAGFLNGTGGTSAIASIVCPAVKQANASIASGRMIVLDQNAPTNVRCNLFSMATVGSSYEFFQTGVRISNGSSTTFQTILFPALSSAPLDWHFYGCELPPSTTIVSYQVVEN